MNSVSPEMIFSMLPVSLRKAVGCIYEHHIREKANFYDEELSRLAARIIDTANQ